MTEKKDPVREFQKELDSFGRVTRMSYGDDPDKLSFYIEPFTSNIVVPFSIIAYREIWVGAGYSYKIEVIEWTHKELHIQLRGSK